MEIKWTRKAVSDVTRLYEFLAQVNKSAAAYVVQDLARAPGAVLASPRIGEQLDEFESHEVRRIIVGQYEMRYEVREGVLYILRFWHTREGRWSCGVQQARLHASCWR